METDKDYVFSFLTSVRRSGTENIIIKNLDKEIDHKGLHETFSSFGNILDLVQSRDKFFWETLGYGFVQYASEKSAQEAIEKLNGMLLNGKQVYVGPFLPKKRKRDVNRQDQIY
ncbi:hypothetical protein ACS0TY_031783 [Phlomoides rotata]